VRSERKVDFGRTLGLKRTEKAYISILKKKKKQEGREACKGSPAYEERGKDARSWGGKRQGG